MATDGRTFLKNPNLLTTLLTTNFLKPWQSLAICGRTFSSVISRSQRFWQLLATPEYKIDKSGIPINIKEVGIESFKRLLLEMCIREARWIGKHPNSLKLQKVPIEEFEQTFDYGLKDITKLDDFNQVVD